MAAQLNPRATQTFAEADYEAMPAPGDGAAPQPHKTVLLRRSAPFVAEFVGTFVLVFTVACVELSAAAPTWGWTAIGSVLMVMVYSMSSVSGGNLNPAVSLTLGVLGALEWITVLGYCLAQLAGGLVAGSCAAFMFFHHAAGAGAGGPSVPSPWYQAALAELIYTTLLCFVFCSCLTSKRNNPKDDSNQFFGLSIGLAMVAGGHAAGGICGAMFNPAVALGLTLTAVGGHFSQALLWILFQLLGGLLAAGLFRLTRPEELTWSEAALLAGDFKPQLYVRCLSEFLGTFMLVFTVGLNLVQGSPAVAWAAAAALASMIYSLGNVSGGHFNPAVTLAVVLSDRDKCSPQDGLLYLVLQALGAAVAGVFCADFHAAGPGAQKTIALTPGFGYSLTQACFAELVFTAVLAYVVLACATVATPASQRSKQNSFFALAIGACVAVGGLAVGSISGGELNPAVSLGISIASSIHPSGPQPFSPLINFVLFAVWELCGGLLAAGVFRLTHVQEFEKQPPTISRTSGHGRAAFGGA